MTASRKELLFGPMRIPFLLLVPACVLLGVATARWAGAELAPLRLVLIALGALAAHISVNALNEYHDFRSGLDLRTEPTPFSGGSGTLPQNPTKAHFALGTGLVALLVTAGIGAYFTLTVGWGLLPLGLLGIVVVVSYTPLLTRNVFLCLIAPGLGFGPAMVMGTYYVLAGSYSWTAFVASLVPLFLVSDLLLLNQFPDAEADATVGRHHLVIARGTRSGVVIYGLFLAAAYLTLIVGCLLRVLPLPSLLGLLSLVLAIPTFRGAARYAETIPKLIPFLGKNVVVILLTPLLVAVGLFIAT
ncbi:MAG: prenyltransferase [bacterium]